MTWADFYLLCFVVGALWSVASLLLGGLHLGHSGHASFTHHGHAWHVHGPVKIGSASSHGSGSHASGSHHAGPLNWLGAMVNPSCFAVYLAWFGGVGYLLTRHSGFTFWINLVIAVALGLTGAFLLAAFLRFLQSHEKPLDPADYDMIGTLGHVSSPIRAGHVGEVIYVRDGARRPLCARSEDGSEIARGEEVVVTRFEKGIAYVRTWEAMTQPGSAAPSLESSQKETRNVE